MPINLNDYYRVKHLEEWCNKRKLLLGRGSYGQNTIAIKVPHEQESYNVFPGYTRGTCLVDGTVEDLLQWIRGYDAAMLYLLTLGIDNEMIRKREDKLAGKALMEILKKE